MRGSRIITAAAVLAAAVGMAAPASADTLRTPAMHAFGFKVSCGVQLKPLGGISCFSEVLPSTELDGYVEVHSRGEPKLGERGDNPWRPGKNAKLRRGQAWKRAGVRCALSKDGTRTIRCLNAEGIGFKLGPADYEPIGAG